MIEKYLYDVVRRLPEKQKDDIEQELRILIDDMIAEREDAGETDREVSIKAVLHELGEPARLARSYRGENNSLISGIYYDSYIYILKIVLICVAVSLVIANIVSAVVKVVEAEMDVAIMWSGLFQMVSIPSILLSVFGGITLAYAIMERCHVKLEDTEPWSVEKLPEIPYKKEVIKRSESVTGLVFGILVAVMFICIPQLMGAWVKQDGVMVSIPLFNLSIWNKILPLFLISIIAGLIDTFVKLFIGKYNYFVMIVTIVTDAASLGVCFFLFKKFPVWNTSFISEIQVLSGRAVSSLNDALTYFNTARFTDLFLWIISLCFLLDIGTTVYYTVRYSKMKK